MSKHRRSRRRWSRPFVSWSQRDSCFERHDWLTAQSLREWVVTKPCHHGCGMMVRDDPHSRLMHAIDGCPVLEFEMLLHSEDA